jgi:hypothetical protein
VYLRARDILSVSLSRPSAVVQILSTRLREGKDAAVLYGHQCEPDSRSVMPSGWALVFATAFTPSPAQLGHVKVSPKNTSA